MSMKLNISSQRHDPLVKQLQGELRRKIQRRELRPGQKLPSMRQLVADCGISLGMVKQAINTLTVEGYLRAERGSGVYVAERQLETQAIALVVPAIIPAISDILCGIKAGLQPLAPRVFIHDAKFDFADETQCVKQLDSAQVSGAIIYPPPMREFTSVLRELTRRGVCHVLVDTAFDHHPADSVTTDCHLMGVQAMQYLLDRGHRRIGIIDHSADASSQVDFRLGMAKAATECALSFDQLPRVVTDAADLNPIQPWANGERAAVRLLAQHPDITALIGMNEHLALGALRGVRASGRRVPTDVSVLSLCDMPTFVATDPALTAFGQSNFEMGRLAAERLMAILRGEAGRSTERLRLKPLLFERSSVIPCNRR